MSYTSIVSYAFVAFVLLLCHLSNTEACTADKCVGVEVYYESKCPDSMRFIIYQLASSYHDLKNNLNIEFIPYGKATHVKDSNGKWTFTCQHGPSECEGNKGQACGLEAIEKFEQSDKKQNLKVDFVECAMREEYQQLRNATKHCAATLLNSEAQTYIADCVNSTTGDNLLANYGDKTYNLQPSVTFVPTIVINKVYSDKNQQQARTNFKGLICDYLADSESKPTVCM